MGHTRGSVRLWVSKSMFAYAIAIMLAGMVLSVSIACGPGYQTFVMRQDPTHYRFEYPNTWVGPTVSGEVGEYTSVTLLFPDYRGDVSLFAARYKNAAGDATNARSLLDQWVAKISSDPSYELVERFSIVLNDVSAEGVAYYYPGPLVAHFSLPQGSKMYACSVSADLSDTWFSAYMSTFPSSSQAFRAEFDRLLSSIRFLPKPGVIPKPTP